MVPQLGADVPACQGALQVIAQHREWLEGKEVRGRIYISEQGINAQYGGLRRDAEGYARWLADTQPLFKVAVVPTEAVACGARLVGALPLAVSSLRQLLSTCCP